jgi:hypothetical protein
MFYSVYLMPDSGLKDRNKLHLHTILLKIFYVFDDNIYANTNLSQKNGMGFRKIM